MTKNIATIHHLSCTGGTLISKCLAAMQNIVLLSEVHPHRPRDTGFNPFDPVQLFQTANHHQINFSTTELEKIFLTRIDQVYEACQQHGHYLILRDHSHSDFLIPQPNEKAVLNNLLRENYTLSSVITVRNPIDSYLSMQKNFPRAQFNFDEYCRQILSFITCYKDLPIIHYETFVDDPSATLNVICKHLGVQYDQGFIDRFFQVKLTGDSGRTSPVIEKRPRRDFSEQFRHEIGNSKFYEAICHKLGYPVDPSHSDGVVLTSGKTESKEAHKPTVIAFRKDRLGARLMAIIGARLIADKYNLPFKFVWLAPTKEEEVEDLTPLSDLLEQNFIEKHLIEWSDVDQSKLLDQALHDARLEEDSIQMPVNLNCINVGSTIEDSAILYDYNMAIPHFEDETTDQSRLNFAKAFEELPLSAPLEQLKKKLNTGKNKEKTAVIHLRRGDLIKRQDSYFFLEGRYAPLPIIRRVIETINKEGKYSRVLLVGEDKAAEKLLCELFDNVDQVDPVWTDNLSVIQTALADIMILSSGAKLYATYSAFSDLASLIGGIEKIDILSMIPNTDQINILNEAKDWDNSDEWLNPFDRAYLAHLYAESGDFTSAVSELSNIVINHRYPNFLARLAQYEISIGNKKKAIQLLEEAVVNGQDYWVIQKEYADILRDNGQLKEAVAVYEKVVDLVYNPNELTKHMKRIIEQNLSAALFCCQSRGDKLGSIAILKKAKSYLS